ncbi:hypothetical protein [Mycoplasma sp. (ex Biomphalaria glabrata)]|nr:hypothetical protein [Mycoplasma sp. (ex Biomphalaria glabrata)]
MPKTIYTAGTNPGKGTYQCIACPYIVELEDGEPLEICPICGVPEYIKIA